MPGTAVVSDRHEACVGDQKFQNMLPSTLGSAAQGGRAKRLLVEVGFDNRVLLISGVCLFFWGVNWVVIFAAQQTPPTYTRIYYHLYSYLLPPRGSKLGEV